MDIPRESSLRRRIREGVAVAAACVAVLVGSVLTFALAMVLVIGVPAALVFAIVLAAKWAWSLV